MPDNGNIYYDWGKTLSYNASFNMIISMRGLGKTYGIRKKAIKDFIKDGSTFVEVARAKESLKGESAIQYGYFDKLVQKDEFPDYMFKVRGTKAYIAKRPANEEDKPKWELIGYFVALTEMQNTKQRTFKKVKNVIFDEFIIDKRTTHRYLNGEYNLFVNLIDSVAREEVKEDGSAAGTDVHVYMLGNSCDLTNPYFVRWGINKQPKEGYTWHSGKLVLLHYVKQKAYQQGKRGTLVGRLVAGTDEESIIVDNEFSVGDEYNIAQKTSSARFQMGIVSNGKTYGIWEDFQKGYVYVNSKIPKNSGKTILALTRDDNTANYLQARKGSKTLKILMDYYYADIMRFSTLGVREGFLDTMRMFGIS